MAVKTKSKTKKPPSAQKKESAPAGPAKPGKPESARLQLNQIIDPPASLIVRDSLGDLSEIKASMRRNGQLQNIVVRPAKGKPGKYELLCGHRRTSVARELKWKEMDALIRHDLSDNTDAVGAIMSENSADIRTALTAVEQANIYKRLHTQFGGDRDAATKVAQYCGTSGNNVRRTIAILDVPKEVLARLKDESITKDAAIVYQQIGDEKTKRAIAARIGAGELKTAPAIERAASEFIQAQKEKGVKIEKPVDGRKAVTPAQTWQERRAVHEMIDDLLWNLGVCQKKIKLAKSDKASKTAGDKVLETALLNQLVMAAWITGKTRTLKIDDKQFLSWVEEHMALVVEANAVVKADGDSEPEPLPKRKKEKKELEESPKNGKKKPAPVVDDDDLDGDDGQDEEEDQYAEDEDEESDGDDHDEDIEESDEEDPEESDEEEEL